MPVPKRRQSRTRRDKRRAQNIKLGKPALSSCPQCKRPKLPHCVCQQCGFYKGREILSVQA